MILHKKVHLSHLCNVPSGVLHYTSYYGDDYVTEEQNIPDEWNLVIVCMCGHPANLVPRDKVQEFRDFMLDTYGASHFWNNTEPKVFEIDDWKGQELHWKLFA